MPGPRALILLETREVGGPGKGIVQFLKSRDPERCQPTVVSFSRTPDSAWPFRDAVQATGTPFLGLGQRFGLDPAVIPALRRLVRRSRPDLLESHGYKSHIICWILSRLEGIPWIAFFHGWTRHDLKLRVYNKIEEYALRAADQVVFVSQGLQRQFEASRPAVSRATVIPNAADPVDPGASFPPDAEVSARLAGFGYQAGDRLVGVIGRLSPEKGQLLFTEAMRDLADRPARIRGLIVGEGHQRPELEAAIRSAGLQHAIWLAGHQDEPTPWMLACEAVCLPSLSEGMPHAALEAMMLGKPVVAFAVGGIPEVVRDGVTGVLVEPGNPAALARAILGLVENPPLLRRMGVMARERALLEFDPSIRARRLHELYETMARRQGA